MPGSSSIELADGAEIAYELVGSGPPLVFVAGLGDDRTLFEPLVEALADRHTCLSFDNRGSGTSSAPPNPCTLGALADDASELARALGLTPAVVVGCSMGGAIAQEWALGRPDEVTGLVLFNTWARADTHMRLLLEHWTALSRDGNDARLLESLLLFCLSPHYLRQNPGAVEEFLAEPSPAGEGFELQAAACLGHDILPREPIGAPTLIIGGRNDAVVSVESIEELASAIPGAQLHLLDTGHVAFWERLAHSITLLRVFVARLDGPQH